MATRHTVGEAQEDSNTNRPEQGDTARPEQGNRTEKDSENKGKRSTKQKFLHSKAMLRVAGRKRGADVVPAKKVLPQPAHVQAPRTSDTVQLPPNHSQEHDDLQMVRQHHRSDPHTQSHATARSVIHEQAQYSCSNT